MRSSAPEGQHAPRAKQAPPSGSSGATAGPAGATPPSPHANSSSPRPQSSAGLQHKSSSQPQPRGSAAALAAQNRVAPQPRGVAGHPQLQRSQQRSSASVTQTQQLQQRSPPNSSPLTAPAVSGTKSLTPLPKGIQQRLSQAHQQKTSPQALSKSQTSFGAQQQQQQTPPPPPQAQAQGAKPPAFKQGSPSSKLVPPAANPPNFGEYDDQEWDVGVGHLIIDLDADIAQADRGRMSGTAPPSGPHAHQGTPGTPVSEDKHSLKMKIKRTKPPTKTSEAKHEIVKPDVMPASGGAVVMVTGTPTTPQHNGATLKGDAPTTPRSTAVPPRTVYKKDKRRVDVNGTTTSPPPPGASVTPRSLPHTSNPSMPHSSAPSSTSHTTISSSHGAVLPISTPSSQGGPVSTVPTPSGAHHFNPVKSEPPTLPGAPAGRLLPSALQQQTSQATQLQQQQQQPSQAAQLHQQQQQQPSQAAQLHQQQQQQPSQAVQLQQQEQQPSTNSTQLHDCFSQQQQQPEITSPAAKRQKLSDEGAKRDACVGTSVATITEPDCLGPCEPGSSVTLEGIVWHETEGGVLVVNVTWRGKTYVGTLLDCTKHDWAPPRFCDSPTSDLESRTPKGRAKRGRAATSSSNSASAVHTPTTEMNVTETRSGKLRNASVKGRRGAATPNFNPPLSPVKAEVGGTKRKGREGDAAPPPDSKMVKRARSTSRGTPTNSCGSPTPEQQSQAQSQPQPQSQSQPQQPPTPSETPPQPPSSPQLIECPEPNCSKKYKHINGLKYHQSHAHSASHGTNEDESSAAESRGEGSEVEETRQPSPLSPTPLVSTPVDSSSQDLVKPAVLRPALAANPEKGDVLSIAPPQSILLSQQASAGSMLASKSPQHLYVYPNSLGSNGLQKQNGNSAPTVRQSRMQAIQQGNPPGNTNPSLSLTQDAQGSSNNQPKQENQSGQPPHSSPEQSYQHQSGVVMLTPNQIPTSHPLILAQPKPSAQHLQQQQQQVSHATQQQTLHLTQSQLSPSQGQTNTHSLQQPLALQPTQPQLQQQQQQLLLPQPPLQQQPQQQLLLPQPPLQQQPQQQQQQPRPQQPQPQQQSHVQPPQQHQHQLAHHQLQQPPALAQSHPVHLQVSIPSQYPIHTTQQQPVHGLQQKPVTTLLPGQQQLQQQLQSQPSAPQHLKPQIQPNHHHHHHHHHHQQQQQQPPLKVPPPQSAHQPIQQASQTHTPSVYHPQIHDQPLASQQITQPPPPPPPLPQRLELKPEIMNRITPLHSTSQLVPSTRPSPNGTLADSSSAAPSAVSTTALSMAPVPQGTPLSSLPGSTVTTIKMKVSGEGDKLAGKPKDMVNGLLPKKEEEHLAREDARSPAYSDISDANDTAPVIDEDVDSKDFKDEKKPELPIGSAPPYAYGLYFGGYGQPPHPYLMPPLQHPQGLPLKPVDAKDLKEKVQEKDKKDFLPLPGGSDYMKFPPQYFYSYSHLYPPGYPDHPYLRDPLYKEMMEKPKPEIEECAPMEDGDKGPTDLSRSAAHSALSNNSGEKNALSLKENKPSDISPSVKEPLEGRGQVAPDKRPVDPALAYRYMSAYDARLPVVASPMDKPVDGKGPQVIVKPSTPVPLSSPRLGPTPPTNNSNGLNKEEKIEKRPEVKSEGVKPTMETTGPPPPPTSSAYYPPFPYAHVPFDPYRPPIVQGMSLAAGFPPYLAAPPPTLGGLRYQLGVPNGPEDLSPSGAGAAILTSSLYPGSHKIAELQERAQKSPSGQVSSGCLTMSRGGSPLTLIASNPLTGLPPHSLSHMVSSPSFSSSSGIFTSSIAVQQGSLMSSGYFGDRKTPPLGPRLPPHPSLPEGYPYPLLPAQFPPHFTALGMSPMALPSVGLGGPGVPPSGMGGAPPPPK